MDAGTGLESGPIGVDLFCGAGGMSLGFEQAGIHVVAAFDVDPVHVRTYKKNFPDCVTECVDISELTGEFILATAGVERQELDILFGGPPCQGFSEIGHQQVDDPRNDLILEFARLVGELRPKYFVVENVPGLLFKRNRSIFELFFVHVKALGYSMVSPVEKLHASHFGVPQHRQRVFLIGYRFDQLPPHYPEPRSEIAPCTWDAIGDLTVIDKCPEFLVGDTYVGELGDPSNYARRMRGEVQDPMDRSARKLTRRNGITGCLTSKHGAATIA